MSRPADSATSPRGPTRAAALGAALLASAMLAAPPAASAQGIQRCQAADGTEVYTDQPCGAMGARPMPLSGELARRLTSDRHDYPDAETAAVGRRGPAGPEVRSRRRSAASGCARSPTQLLMDLEASWAAADVNGIAASYHWAGLGHRDGQAVMDRLAKLADRPLEDSQYFDATLGGGVVHMAGAGTGGPGMVQVVLGDGSSRRVQDFRVTSQHGCYFIRF